MKKIIYTVLFILILEACDQRPNPEWILEKTNLSTPSNYKLLNFKSNWGVGETEENYTLLISRKDYLIISEEIEGKIFFKRLEINKKPKQAFTNVTDLNKTDETACWYDNKYFYQIFNPNPGEVITIELEKDSLMYINYNDL